MSTVMESTQLAPSWVGGEMPPGYQNRLAEIERLTKDLEIMGRFGGLLWQTGSALNQVVRDAFAAMKLDIATPASSDGFFVANLDARRRLIVYVSSGDAALQKKSGDLADVFKILHEFAQEADRVVLVANSDPHVAPEDRDDAVTPEALTFLTRLGVNFLPTSTLFALWKQSLDDADRVRRYVERLYEQDGGAAAPVPGLPR